MTNTESQNESPEQDELQAEEEQQSAEPTDQDGAEETAELSEVEQLRQERDGLNEKLLRTMADYQNYARRARQDVVAAREQQVSEIAKSLLPVLDHFDRAMEVKDVDESVQSVLSGIQIVREELLKSLAQFGIEPMKVEVGDEFDPNFHEALMRQEAEGIESNHVATVLQPGYTLNGKSLRPAQVCVTP